VNGSLGGKPVDAASTWLAAAGQFLWTYLVPHGERATNFGGFALGSIENILKSYFWFIVVGSVVYALFLRPRGERLSPIASLKHLLPARIYGHRSFRVDLTWLPINWIFGFLLFAGLTVGAGAAQAWLVQRLGHSPLSIDGGFGIALQIAFTLLGVDMARFVWHYQAHFVPFFWEFHKGHHTPEVLHPVAIRTHPVDMFVRLLYMNVGGGLLGGGMMYVLGIDATAQAATYLALIGFGLHVLQGFEHSHVPVSFGKTLNKFIYPASYHPFHHSALPEHRDKNLGITGGLTLWDRLVGTLYVPAPDEYKRIVFGSTLEEIGDHNPHRSVWLFFKGPFIAAAKTLRRPPAEVATAQAIGAPTG